MPPKIRAGVAMAAGICGILEALFGFGMLISCFILSGSSGGGAIAPYWGAIPMLVSGGIAIGTWPTRNQCLLIATLVINIILTILLSIAAALTALASAVWSVYLGYLDHATTGCVDIGKNCHCDYHVINKVKCDDLSTIGSLLKCFVAFSILGMIISLALAIIGCMGICCYKAEENAVAVTSGGQVIVIQNPQQQQQQQQHQQPPPYDGNQQKQQPGLISYQPPAY